MACVVLDAVNNHDIVNEISIVQSAIRANNGVSIGTLQQLFEATANDLVNIEFKYVISCAASIGLDPVQELYSGLTDEIHLFLNDPKSALASNIDAVIQGAASIAAGTTTDLGEGTQGLVELIHTATPLETAIISVTNAGQAAPQVTGIVNDPVIGLDGKQKVIIQGYGFANGATINWQDVTGGGSGTAITADGSVTATTITAYMNFTNQSATWRIQVVNPNVPPSNWFSFQVTANTTAKPDLVPQSITLNSSSVLAGGTVAITFTVLNQGTGPAAASMTGFRLGTSNTVPPGSSADIPNSLISTPALGAGLPVQQSQSLTIPSATGAGTYYIWVVVDDVAGSTLGQSNTNNDYASSPVLAVTVGQTPVPTPQSPGTTSDTGYTVSTATPTMQWFGSGATSYELAISEAPYGTSNVVYDKVAVPGTSSLLVIPAGQLKDGTKYRWNMQASNSAGLSVWSSYLYFTVDLTAVPPAPTPVSPGTGTSPGSTLTTLVPTFSWSTVTGATGYGLYVEDAASGVLVYNNDAVGNITSFAMPSGTLLAGHSYVWNVQASNTSGFSAYSTKYYFVEQGTAPSAPTPVSPGTGTSPGSTLTTLVPTFSWSTVTGATGYGLYVEDVASGVLVYNNDAVGNITSFAMPSGTLVAAHSYVWNVQASNTSGFSAYSTRYYFVEPGTASTGQFQVGTRIAAQSGGANVRNAQLASTPLFAQEGGVHGTIASGPIYGTAGGYTGNWWAISWDSEPPSQNSQIGWSAESTITLAPTAGDVPKPNFSSSYYASANPFWNSGYAPVSTNPPGTNHLNGALGNCTWYTYGRMLELGASPTQIGVLTMDADQWAAVAGSNGIPVDTNPTVHSIAERDSDPQNFPAGHVAVVESVNADGTITVTESSSGLITTGNWMFLWRHRTVSPGWFSHFIHISLSGGSSAPAVPTSLSPGTSTSPGPTTPSTTVTLSWSGTSGATYEVAVKDVAAGTYIDDTTVSSTTFTASNLSPGKQYVWNVDACNGSACSNFAPAIYFQTPASAPAVPTSLSPGTSTSPGPTTPSTTVTLSWSGTSGATYEVAVKDVAAGTYIDDTTVSSTTFTASNLSPGKQYVWNVDACNGSACSNFAPAIYFQTPASAPAVPTSLSPGTSTSPGPTTPSTTVTLSWSGTSGATYEVAVKDVAAGTYIDDTTVSSTTFTASNLSPGKQYVWNVDACNGSACSNFAPAIYFQTPASAPAVPTSLSPGTSTSPGPTTPSTTVTLSWSGTSGATYEVAVKDVAAGTYIDDTTVSSTTFTASNLSPGKQYVWNVDACNGSACSNFAPAIYFQTPASAPAVPTSLSPGTSTSPGPTTPSTTVTLSWSGTSGATYEVAVKDVAAGTYIDDTTVSSTTFTASNLSPGKQYVWNVDACNGSACSNFAPAIYFQTPASAPAVPTSLSPGTSTSPGPTTPSTTVTLSWSGTSGATYEVAVKDVAAGTYIDDTTVSSTTFTASNLSPGKQYVWNVDACNGSACSNFAPAIYFQTPASAPAVPTSLSPGTSTSPGPTTPSTTVTLSWSGTSGATYEVAVKDVAAGTYIDDTTVSSTTFTASNLSPGKQYVWNVDACNGSACSNFAPAIYFQTPASAPAVPTSLSPGTSTSPGPTTPSTTVTLSWSGTSGATYEVAVKDVAAGTYIDDTTVSSTTFTASNLSPGKQYVWNVDACNGSACSNFAPAIYFQTPASAPAVPTSLSPGTSTSPGPTTPSTTVTLSWSGTSGATYEVAVKDVAAGTYIDDTTVSSTTFTASNLSPGKQYVWNVDACNGSACSNFAPAIYFRTP